MVYNNTSHIEITPNAFYEPVGNGTEVSLLKWLQAAEVSVHTMFADKETRLAGQIPFNTTNKFSMMALHNHHIEDHEDTVRIYIKGAPEVVVSKCNETLDEHDQRIDFTYED